MPNPTEPKARVSPARVAALQALMAIEQEGRWANAEWPALQGLGEQDRALAKALVAGVTRRRLALDHALQAHLRQPLAKLAVPLRNALRLGLFQLRHQRTPAHAAVHECVALVRRFGHEGQAKLANAVLRAAQREPEASAPPPLERDPVGHLVAAEGIPAWLGEDWVRRLGAQEALALARLANEEPALWLRPNPLRGEDGPGLGARLREAGLRPEAHPLLGPLAWRVGPVGELSRLPGHAEGRWAVQDPAAMAVGLALGPRPGERVADVGAAPGGKTAHLAALMGGEGELLAVEAQASRLPRLEENLRRLGAEAVQVCLGDGRRLEQWGRFDRILVDAPCSGLGVLARKPDLRHRRRPEELAELAQLQGELLEGAAQALKPGGVLVYATCTVAHEENEAVVEAFLARHPGFRLGGLAETLPPAWRQDVVDGGMMQWWPQRHGCDGFFVARLVAPPEAT